MVETGRSSPRKNWAQRPMIELGAAAHKRTVLRHRNGDALVRSVVATCMESCAAEVAVRLPDDFLARSENPSLLLHFLVIAHSNHVGRQLS